MPTPMRCELISLQSVIDLSYQLACQVRDSGFRPDLVVAVARGGFVPARYLCDYLHLQDMTSIKVQHYTGPAKMEAKAWVKYPLSGDVQGKRVLIVDDVNDTGDTLVVARTHVEAAGAAEVRTAVLHEKATSPVHADFHVAEVLEWRWIIYPWARVEDIGGFIRDMDPPTADEAQIKDRLRADYGIHLEDAELQRILSLIRIPEQDGT
ncbi:phosphoribosyltransferase [Thioalkalivibrio sulfidiphilus]|uniref:phosphoribosyltransferase n=1 Tax=Thioalkalivibrio sulfidiphilus TaxID=1033854 RepID=UPI00037B1A51|nr:phosphoribosyltransferase [Thioalkalivibrio sulfidiphilus]